MTIIVPYRDRPEHLKEFVAAMSDGNSIVVVDQDGHKPFNRGKLINVGYMETKQRVFAVNDVDMIPQVDYPMGIYGTVTQCAESDIQKVNYLGGCSIYDDYTFERSGGYHNNFWSRAEDNEYMFNLRRLRIPIKYSYIPFTILPHPRSGPEFITELWVKAQLPRKVNMLKTCQYSIISKEQMAGYTMIKVKI